MRAMNDALRGERTISLRIYVDLVRERTKAVLLEGSFLFHGFDICFYRYTDLNMLIPERVIDVVIA
jgi:hypothetical protein